MSDVGLAEANEKSWLDQKVTEGGANLSAGTRQLLCVSRALLRQSKIILLDEASANVDTATDKQLQSMLRSHCFKESTVLVVAHRLETIMDADRIAVLDGGKLIEFDTPAALLASADSQFAGLAEQMRKNQRG